MRLRSRFTLWFTLAALVPIAAAALATREVVSDRYRQQFERAKESARGVAEREVAAQKRRVERAAAALADPQHPDLGAFLLELEKGGGELSPGALRRARERAEPVKRGLDLDVLLILNEDGSVVAAPHYRAAQGAPDPGTPRAVGEDAYAAVEPVWDEDRVGEALTLQAAREVREGEHALTVVAGARVGDDLLAPVRRLDRVSAELAEPGVVESGEEQSARGAEAGGAGGEGAVLRVPLADAGGDPEAVIEATVSDRELHRVLGEVTRNTLLLGVAALVGSTALGFWVARRMTRDLDALVRGAEAASRGELEHRVRVRARDEIGELAGAFNTMMGDLEESKARLASAERIAAWRDIARRLAHEIKNPLTPIQMSMETLRRAKRVEHPSFDEVFDESTQTVLDEVGRLKRTVDQLSELAKLPPAEPAPCDLNDLARRALGLYAGSADLEGDLADELPAVWVDVDQLVQVVVNLLENAREAAGEGGRVRLVTRAGSSGGAEIWVEDDGPGIAPQVRDRLFEPYVTTKGGQGGTGLGLAIADRIVADHGGSIAVEDAPLGGARFRLALPAAGARGAARATDRA